MAIDWSSIFKGALDAATKEIEKKGPGIEDFLRQVAKGHEKALRQIGEAFTSGGIDEETFNDELDDEAKTFALELRAVAVMTKAIAERAANAFRDALIAGVKTAVLAAI